jgi:SAM-dependent methyltransferase
MSDSPIDWLELREPRDHAARCMELTSEFVDALGAEPRVLDLGCGTGSNFRYLAPKVGRRARWLCVDHDPNMLGRAAALLGDFDVEFQQRDLARELPSLALGPGAAITTSAFLDMTSAPWLDRLAVWCRGRPLLAAMSFDGRLEWQPFAPEDESIRLRWLALRGDDQGFGPPLGPDAANYLAERLRRAGHRVRLATSPWRLGPGDRPLLETMLRGIGRRLRAATSGESIDGWLDLRRRQIGAGKMRLTVGHVDLLSLPPGLGESR